MAYGDQTAELYTTGGTPNAGLSVRDFLRAAVSGINPMVQEVTHAVTGIQTYRRVVPTPGTPVGLNNVTALPCIRVLIQALRDNTSYVAVGGTNVLATEGVTQNGFLLGPGEWVEYEIDDANDIKIDARVTNEGVTYTVLT